MFLLVFQHSIILERQSKAILEGGGQALGSPPPLDLPLVMSACCEMFTENCCGE